MTQSEPKPEYQVLHDQAVQQGLHHYMDPKTGFLVFTELYHLDRGSCCYSACRHCPYGFQKS